MTPGAFATSAAAVLLIATAAAAAEDGGAAAAAPRWEGSASLLTYFVQDPGNYLQPTVMAERGALHLEARYNYEAQRAGSLWIGWNWSTGEEWVLAVTPMLGGVFGEMNGVAPGFHLSLSHGAFELASESEFVFDTDDSAGNFFYTWSELTWSPAEWFRAGLVAQRTRAWETDLDVQRGLLLGLSYRRLDLTVYVFNPDKDPPTVVLGVTANF